MRLPVCVCPCVCVSESGSDSHADRVAPPSGIPRLLSSEAAVPPARAFQRGEKRRRQPPHESERKCNVIPRQRQNLPRLFSELKMNSHMELFSARCSWFVGNVRFLLPKSCLGCLPSIMERDSGIEIVFTPVFFQSVS